MLNWTLIVVKLNPRRIRHAKLDLNHSKIEFTQNQARYSALESEQNCVHAVEGAKLYLNHSKIDSTQKHAC